MRRWLPYRLCDSRIISERQNEDDSWRFGFTRHRHSPCTFRFQKIDLAFERCAITDHSSELERFQHAPVSQAKSELAEIQAKAEAELGVEEAAVFEAHAMMLEDPELLEVSGMQLCPSTRTPKPP